MNPMVSLQNNLRSIIRSVNQMIGCFRIQNYDGGLRIANRLNLDLSTWMGQILNQMEYFNEERILVDPSLLNQCFTSILSAQEQQDYVLLADLYELQLYPIFIQLEQWINEKEGICFDEEKYNIGLNLIQKNHPSLHHTLLQCSIVDTFENSRYVIEPTYDGRKTLGIWDGDKTISLHSNYDISKESYQLAKSWYQEEVDEYIIFGLGLGHPMVELLNIDSSKSVKVFEVELEVIQLALAFGELEDKLSNGQLEIIYDPDFKRIGKELGHLEGKEFIVFHPSLQVLPSSPMKEKLENYFVQRSSIENSRGKLAGNFKKNLRNCDGFVDELRKQWKDKDIYIIAAGPSLDQNFQKLKLVKGNGIILATGTVYRKLLQGGIRPDYVIVTDPNDRVYRQIAGVESESIPMLCLSTAFHGFAKHYQGKKYFICQKGYDKTEQLADDKGLHCFQTGGSVSTTALDIAIEFQCKRIIFLGLDLGYTNELAHASDTSRRNAVITEGLRRIEDINGNLMYTNKAMDMYRQWIEKRIIGTSNIEFIDATEGGAKIQGMKIMTLQEVLNQ